ncbi:MAG: PQQ-binding-like beta-propeller repeat protein [Sphingobacteriales bacterium]|nr:PQQ-binding-like beta-propeller repeat protein [Sphingobacteriales bacterium]
MQKPAPSIQSLERPVSFIRVFHLRILLSISLIAINFPGFAQKTYPSGSSASVPSPDDRGLRIAFLTDIHVSPGAVSEPNLENIVAEINTGDYDFAVVTGDLTNTGLDTELVTVHRILSQLKIPLHIVPGNHETNWSESACQTFPRLWGNDRFFFISGNYLFIGFDTGPFLKMGDGHVKEEDVQWIEQTLSQTATQGRTVISLAHYPLGDGLDNWYEVTDILKKYNTRLVLCGHGHRLSLHNFDGLPGLMGRAALIGSSDIPGYNILTLRNDSACLYEKRLHQPIGAPFIAFSLSDPSPVTDHRPSMPRPDSSINIAYPPAVIPFRLNDTASIFTGVLPVDKHTIIYGNSRGQVISLDPLTHKVRWRNQYPGSIYCTPVYGKGIVAFSTVDGYLHGVDAGTGKEKWNLPTGQPGISEGLVKDDALYIGTGSHFYKLHITDGRLLWKNTNPEGQLQARPVLSPDGDNVIFGAWDRRLYCLDAATGQLKWQWDNGKQQKLYSPGNVVPAIADGKVFIVAPDRYMTAIDRTTGKTLWRNNSRHVRESMGISADGRQVYAKLMNDTIIAVSTTSDSFHLNWEANAAFGYEHNPCPIIESNGVVYAGTKNGVFVATDAATGRILLEHRAGNSSINGITADREGNIWISLIEGSIMEFVPPARTAAH